MRDNFDKLLYMPERRPQTGSSERFGEPDSGIAVIGASLLGIAVLAVAIVFLVWSWLR